MAKTPGRISSRIALVALALAAALPGRFAIAQGCQGDVVPNGIVNGADLGTLISYWGPRTDGPNRAGRWVDARGPRRLLWQRLGRRSLVRPRQRRARRPEHLPRVPRREDPVIRWV